MKEVSRKDDVLKLLLANLSSKQLLKQLLRQMQEEQGFQLDELIDAFQEAKQEISIPLSIFSHRLPPAEALCKYLKEEEHLSNQEIAQLLNRNEKSIWATYQRAGRRMKQKFIRKKEKHVLPISIFKERTFSLMESVVLYLNEVHKLTNPQIAKMLRKSPNSMAVLLKRAKEKNDK